MGPPVGTILTRQTRCTRNAHLPTPRVISFNKQLVFAVLLQLLDLPAQVDSPAAADAQRFYLHPSVAYWADMETTFASWYSPQRSAK